MRGFTLIEVVVALAVLAIALGAAIHAGSTHAHNVHALEKREVAAWVAANQVARYESGIEEPVDGATNRHDMGGRSWVAETRIESVAPESRWPLPEVDRIEVRVREEGDGEERAIASRSTHAAP
ncbi:type II secretion system minor pseudopilin GspI [Thioalkalivibrio sp. ALE19]|uniref:type II secretion system minor pseudopilin GspI n=1 Tax=Thioalkalivibrio sp. ALE19 TaxID=1266909 RepID=UPI0004140501|nr:type II secretion system minor pseudopilin GspI [Thioalkalivibrio sp. ALE19]